MAALNLSICGRMISAPTIFLGTSRTPSPTIRICKPSSDLKLIVLMQVSERSKRNVYAPPLAQRRKSRTEEPPFSCTAFPYSSPFFAASLSPQLTAVHPRSSLSSLSDPHQSSPWSDELRPVPTRHPNKLYHLSCSVNPIPAPG